MLEVSKENKEELQKEVIKSYWNKRADSFLKLRQEEYESEKTELWLAEIKRKVELFPGMKILDVGCGSGFFSLILAKEGAEVTGIDLSEEMVAESKAWAIHEKSTASFMVMDAENLAFPEGTFDLVVSRNVTWNLPHPVEAYKDWLRVLKPGGQILNYDAEYAKDFIKQRAGTGAHSDVTTEQRKACENIYQMLNISKENRPEWDERVLLEATGKKVLVDRTVGSRLYSEGDRFDPGSPIFCVQLKK